LVFVLTLRLVFFKTSQSYWYLPPVRILRPPIVQDHLNTNWLWVHFFTIFNVWYLCLEPTSYQLDARRTRVAPPRKLLLRIFDAIFYPQYDYLFRCNLTLFLVSFVQLTAPSTARVLGTTPFSNLLPSLTLDHWTLPLLKRISFH
jgi:hypothetical protein